MTRRRFSRAHAYALAIGAAIAIILLAVAFGASRARAATPRCAPYDDMIGVLKGKYDEYPAGGGIVRDDLAVETLVSRDKSTWTILAVRSDGVACIIAAGQDWSDAKVPPPGEDS